METPPPPPQTKLEGQAHRVNLFQAYGLGKRFVKNCHVRISRETRMCQIAFFPESETNIHPRPKLATFPLDICSIVWEVEGTDV
jgi:hypothetical protein